MPNGFLEAFTFSSLLAVGSGVLIGYIVGVLPGLNRATVLAAAIPVTYYLSPVAAIGLLIGISKGAASGGAITAILINTPGEASSVATCLDGYPMARAGRARTALRIAIGASVAGDVFATLVLFLITGQIASLALMVGPVELAALLAFALLSLGSLAANAPVKGLISGALGVLAGSVGIDVETGVPRFTFGIAELYDGVPLVAAVIGLLAMTEMLVQFANPTEAEESIDLDAGNADDKLTTDERHEVATGVLRGSIIGTLVGIVPGIGASVASFGAYSWAQRSSRTPERFGRGAPAGVAAAESADNAVVPASFIPLFTLGVPGSVPAAILIGAFMIHGVTPGPMMISQHPELMAGVYGTILVAALLLLPIGLLGLRVFARIADVSPSVIVPVIIFLCIAGAYLNDGSMFGVYVMLFFAVVGLLFHFAGLSIVLFIISFILAPLLELSVRQSIILLRGDPSNLIHYPFALAVIALGLGIVLRSSMPHKRGFGRPNPQPQDDQS